MLKRHVHLCVWYRSEQKNGSEENVGTTDAQEALQLGAGNGLHRLRVGGDVRRRRSHAVCHRHYQTIRSCVFTSSPFPCERSGIL